MHKIIEKKCWPEMFKYIKSGIKEFDIRLDKNEDKDCKPGDIQFNREYDPIANIYTGNEIEKRIDSVTKPYELGFWKKSDIISSGLKVVGFGNGYFEIFLDGFDCIPGGYLKSRGYAPNPRRIDDAEQRTITYVINTKDIRFWPEADKEKYGFVIMGLK